jgi:PAS domain S-box-containing protein
MRRLSIRKKVFFTSLLVSFVTTMLVSSYVIWKAVGVLKTRTFEELDLLALTSSEITVTTLRDLALQLHEITANEKFVDSLLSGLTGETGLKERTRVKINLGQALQHSPHILAMALRDLNGKILLEAGIESLCHPEWQPIAVNLEGTPIEMAQNPRPDPARKRLSVEFGLRLANDRQTPVGYLTAVFDLYRVHDLIVNARILKRSGQVLLAYLDQAQVVYLFPPHHLVGKSPQLAPAADSPMALALRGQNGAMESTDDRGVRVLAAYRHLPEFGWGLVAGIDASEAYQPTYALIQFFLGVLLAGIGLSFLASWRVSKVIVRPIHVLVDAVRHFAGGDRNVRVPVTSSDEIAELTVSFNDSVQCIAQQHAELIRFKAVLEHSRDAVGIHGMEGAPIYVNPACLALCGYTSLEQLAAETLFQHIDAEDQGRFEQEVWPQLQAGHWEGEIRIRHSSGGPVLVWMRAGSVPATASQPVLIYTIMRDISRRKAMENALREAEEHYHGLFTACRDAIMVTDREDRVTDVNEPAFIETFGYTREEIAGKTARDLYVDGEQSIRFQDFSQNPGSSLNGIKIIEWRRKNGDVFVGATSFSPIYDSSGAVKGAMGITRDISDRIRDMEQLRQAYDELKSLDRLKDQFLAGVTHDLRTPLIPVCGFLEMLLKQRFGPITPKQEKYLKNCLIGVSRELTLVDELLDYTRLQSGKMSIRQEPLDLCQVLQSSISILALLAESKGIELETTLPAEPSVIDGDYNKLLRVFNNLFSNAVKYNRSSGRVVVRCWKREDGRYQVDIEDTGMGIPEEELAHIFKGFYRVRPQDPKRPAGSGIGLAVVQELVRLHQGELNVTSKMGEGSLFSLIFKPHHDG